MSDSMEPWDRLATRERRRRLNDQADARELRGKFRLATRRSMRASMRHWRIRLAALRAS